MKFSSAPFPNSLYIKALQVSSQPRDQTVTEYHHHPILAHLIIYATRVKSAGSCNAILTQSKRLGPNSKLCRKEVKNKEKEKKHCRRLSKAVGNC